MTSLMVNWLIESSNNTKVGNPAQNTDKIIVLGDLSRCIISVNNLIKDQSKVMNIHKNGSINHPMASLVGSVLNINKTMPP